MPCKALTHTIGILESHLLAAFTMTATAHTLPAISTLSITARTWAWTMAALLLWAAGQPIAQAGPLRDRLAQRAQADAQLSVTLPPGVRVLQDLAYGTALRQRMDVYLPPRVSQGAPVIFLVHGGAWRTGDKAHARLLQNKLNRWVPAGVVLVSINYRLLPQTPVQEQVRDVAHALAYAQQQAPAWGADPSRFIAMGHSAGAHLVALLAANPAAAQAVGASPVRATVALDSAAMDVPYAMEQPHLPLYDEAFGSNPMVWRALSPVHQWTAQAAPVLAVCSTQRATACEQAQRLNAQARTLGTQVRILPQDLSHGEINELLGLPGRYTSAVEGFMNAVAPGFLP